MSVARVAPVVLSLVPAILAACTERADDAERFREPIPGEQEVALAVPKGGGVGTARQGLQIAGEGIGEPSPSGEGTGAITAAPARYYQLTRDLTAAVDVGTAVILGGVWTIVSSPPTTLESRRAVWGPGSANALEPAVWRFTVTEVGDAEYDYVLEGQPKTGGDFRTVLSGHGYGRSRPEHKQGWFLADNDAFRALDPARARDAGTTKVTYDLRTLPATIAVELRPPAAKGRADIRVTHAAGGAGEIEISALSDLDPSKTTKLEDLHLASRWTTSGSGRADLVIKDGDLPFVVDASECWSTSFSRVFYADSAGLEPKAGDPSLCTFSAR